ncbi:MAG: hypothetical protein IPM24_01445 [Bryobacterales bacterium]|nr:hypothetical protein [Bryobacterales bacterium]
MGRTIFVALLPLLLFTSGAPAQRRAKAPDLEVVTVKAQRAPGQVHLDCKIRVTGQKPITGLVLSFDFLTDENRVVTTQTAEAEEPYLEPGEESEMRVALNDPVRAVGIRVNAFDKNKRELSIGRNGPFPID